MRLHSLVACAVRGAALGTTILIVAGCASPASISAGASESEVIGKLGPPRDRYRLVDGSVNLDYSTAPMGQQAWMINVADGRVRRVAQVLTIEEFAKVRIGADTKQDIRVHFGQTVQEIHLVLAQRDVWSYRMKQDNLWPIWMNVQFDSAGIVREVFPTQDPATLGDGERGPR